ncbi:hypothetical protein IJ531_05295 [bacterium]|nr:hypothetical protein [bacterium]
MMQNIQPVNPYITTPQNSANAVNINIMSPQAFASAPNYSASIYNQGVQYPKNYNNLALQGQIDNIKQQLQEIDAKSIRPLRAGEADKLQELETEAQALRDELHRLESSVQEG